jgi:hypothetical protein
MPSCSSAVDVSDGDAELEHGEGNAGRGGAAPGPARGEGDEFVPRQRLDVGVDVLEVAAEKLGELGNGGGPVPSNGPEQL